MRPDLPATADPAHLLIVDDDLDFAHSLARLLGLEGYAVSVAHDSAGAMELAERADIALVDIRLGHEDGVHLAVEMLKRDPELLVVMITAYASAQTAIKALRAGIYDYLCKPFEPDDLIATVGRCFDRLRLARDRAEAEERLRRSRRMEAVGRLAAGIAHDFNNLLAVVVGNLKLAQEELTHGPRGDRAALDELVRDALDAAQDGIATNRRLLAVGRAQTLLPRVVDVGRTVGAMARRLERALGEEIALHLALPGAPFLTHVDPRQFEACLLNLAINARDAGAGRVRLAVEPWTVEPASPLLMEDMAPGPYVGVVLADDGCGMSAEVLEQAMTPFFSTKPTDQGSGLGLSTAYGFARQSGGTLLLESVPGEGTSVTLLLPALPAGAEADALPEPDPEADPPPSP
ncbi:response regulator [Xanthobacter autotrophicus DSM 431]|uniref:response regulator n=1 Tax=Xanthobacter nonsaccharivorans TaxID=3119912 RepID=UPI00372C6D92